MIHLAIVEDHVLMRQLMCEELNALDEFEVVADFSTSEELLARITQLRVDMVMMDVTLPGMDGIEATATLRARGFDLPVLCLTMHLNEPTYRRAMSAGASGYAVKQESFDELLVAIRRVARGEHYASSGLELTQSVVPRLIVSAQDQALLELLTAREREVVSLIAAGKSTAQISGELDISERTVDFHRRNASDKTRLKGIAEMTRFAMRTGLFV